ncbi:Phosphodiest-domain-containing protein [Dacryopinax primogenitus]|uniref:Phosphodiest-domain-containing protein n=1 Tax=Dacryopinax primogenitus (strain DJM 731) TaxID=1858805 RepID=M5FTB1_DACPD|nr:Phosphodiest-domain-containing protein [Dacryopinax primogenitus]EJT98619.1 Phosphodiest-domain-containing protein [Dacryopinax primogenitus]
MSELPAYPPSYHEKEEERNDEEAEGLLTGEYSPEAKSADLQSLSTASLFRTAGICISVILFGLLAGKAVSGLFRLGTLVESPQKSENGDVLLNNGTHQFRSTVIMVSLDGLRADYVDRGITPHLLEISRQGLRAKYMKPVFPTLTFPNHWSLMTGLYPETHGIIANDFWDPVSTKEFVYTDPERSWDPYWWSGEPVWATAGKAGLTTANLMWPGPPVHRSGQTPTYYIPFSLNLTIDEKLEQIFTWLDYPLDVRPRLITAYSPDVDMMGHLGGPDSEEVAASLKDVDVFARDLHAGLKARNLDQIVSVIFVSDHGMTSTSNIRLVYLDDILGPDLVSRIAHEDGWPNVGLRFPSEVNTSHVLELLESASLRTNSGFGVFTPDTMPEKWHFRADVNERIAPIFVAPHLGWAITNHHEHEVIMAGDYTPKGNHGYDNDEPDMHAIFVADGPFATMAKEKLRKAKRHEGDDEDQMHKPTVIDGFASLEVYNLVCRLLGINGVPNNGTQGFWETYLP